MADLRAQDYNDYDPENYLELAVDIDATDDFDREVLAPLRAAGLDAEFPSQGGGTPMDTWTAVIQLVSTSVATLTAVVQLVAAWQRKHRPPQPQQEQQSQTEVWRIRSIERSGQPPLVGAQILNEVEVLHYITGNTGNIKQQAQPIPIGTRGAVEVVSASMDRPNIGEIVWYMVPSQRFVPAIVVRVHDMDIVNLVVFGDADDGPAFVSGATPKTRVRRWQRKDPNDTSEYPTAGMWFAQTRQSAPAGAPGTSH